MLGDGIVSFGVAVVTCCFRNEKASAKMVFSSRTWSCTFSAADSKSRLPFSFSKCTVIFSSVREMPPSE